MSLNNERKTKWSFYLLVTFWVLYYWFSFSFLFFSFLSCMKIRLKNELKNWIEPIQRLTGSMASIWKGAETWFYQSQQQIRNEYLYFSIFLCVHINFFLYTDPWLIIKNGYITRIQIIEWSWRGYIKTQKCITLLLWYLLKSGKIPPNEGSWIWH